MKLLIPAIPKHPVLDYIPNIVLQASWKTLAEFQGQAQQLMCKKQQLNLP